MTAAEEISVDAAISAVLSELDAIFSHYKNNIKTTLKAGHVLLPTDFVKHLVKRHRA